MSDEHHEKLKTWKIIAADESPGGEGATEFAVAAPNKPAARTAFLDHGLRGMFGPPAVSDRFVADAMDQPGRVFRLDPRSGGWSPLED
jgi:hypothetical protein